MMTVSSGRTTTQALISGLAACAADQGRWKPTASPPPMAVEAFRKSRRVIRMALSGLDLLRRRMDRGSDPRIRAAAAEVGHGLVDVPVRRIGLRAQQRHCGEDLAALAVSALRHLMLDPGLLHRVELPALRKAFDRHDALASGCGRRERARAHRLAVHVNGAGAALPDAAAELGTLHVEHVAQQPEQRHLRLDVNLAWPPVDGQSDHLLPPECIVIL